MGQFYQKRMVLLLKMIVNTSFMHLIWYNIIKKSYDSLLMFTLGSYYYCNEQWKNIIQRPSGLEI